MKYGEIPGAIVITGRLTELWVVSRYLDYTSKYWDPLALEDDTAFFSPAAMSLGRRAVVMASFQKLPDDYRMT